MARDVKKKPSFLKRLLSLFGLGSFFNDWEMLRALLDSEEDARVLTGADGALVYMNLAAKAFFKNEPMLDALRRRACRDEADKLALAKLQAAVERGADAAVELALRSDVTPDFIEWYRVRVRQTTADCTVWTLTDITAKRSMDAVIRHEIQELGEFMDVLPVGLYQADAGGVISYVNQRLIEWLGYRHRSELQGRKLSDIITGSVVPELDGLWHGEASFKTAAGGVFNAFVSHATYDEHGDTMVRGAVVRDAVGGEAAGAKNDLGMTWLFEEAPVGIAFIDTENVISEANARLFQLFDKKREDVIGARLEEFISRADFAEIEHKIVKVKMGFLPRAHGEVTLKGGKSEKIAAVHMTPTVVRDADGVSDISGVVLYFIDDTARRNLEIQFSQAQKMQAVGQLAGGVAHDFNNLLTAVLGSADLLLETHSPSSPDFDELQNIKNSALHAAELVGRLLSYSRRQALKKKYLDVTDLLSGLKHMLVRLLGTKIDVRMEYGRSSGYIYVDETQFSQVMVNLAVNARDAMQNGGEFIVRSRVENIATVQKISTEDIAPGEYVVIDVTDTGCGMTPEVMSRIFDPFFTTKAAGTDSGSGLGLAMVYGSVHQTDGYINVKSAVGKGTTFSLYFPHYDAARVRDALAQEQSAETQVKAAPVPLRPKAPEIKEGDQLSFAFASDAPPMPKPLPLTNDLTGAGKILLVDDEDGVRAVTKKSLEAKGYTVTACASAEEALEKIADGATFDLLLTDMVMPGMDGIALAEQVKKRFTHAKMLLMSGFSEEAARGEIQNLPDLHFLAKPFSLKELGKKVKEILS